ncbi:MAG: GNAT family N-acetyltransferase [Acidimicrobiales bacterium]
MQPADGGMSLPPGITVRAATPEDDPAIVGLLCETLGWVDDARHRALFAWKHRENPFGPSPGWVALDELGLVGSRTFMRWSFTAGGERVSAVRAVDTATHPRARGKGVFRALTTRGVEEMTSAGVGWVFNTPNGQSAPGYLSMGWKEMGRLPLSVRPAGIKALRRLADARQPADLWSLPTIAGEDAGSVLDDGDPLGELLDAQPGWSGVRTERAADYLRWRYGSGPVSYRAILGGATVRDGVVFFRVRNRGPAREAVIADLLVPRGDRARRAAGRLCQRALDASGADYEVTLGSRRPPGWLPLPRQGPLLTWRALAREDAPAVDEWALSTGDVELF